MQRFTELKVWQRGHALVLAVYRLTAVFPPAECFGIVQQIRRAAVSITCNIAEGAKRQSRHEYARFLNIAEGSLAETDSLLRLARDLDYAPAEKLRNLIDESEELARMLSALRAKVEGRRSC